MRRPLLLLALAAFVFALAVRFPMLLQAGGLFSAASTDDGVHFAAAASLVAGRLPYRDFLFLHPPGIVLALAPFAALGRVIGDADAFALSRVVFITLGAANAGLVVLVLRRLGTAAALTGAAVYATAYPIVYAERSALLEPLGMTCLLGAMALMPGPEGRRRRVWAGVLLGLAAAVKLPFAVPAIVIAFAARRGAPAVLLGAAASATAVCLPFLVFAQGAMVQQLLFDQAGRRRIVLSFGERLTQIFPPPTWSGAPTRALLIAMLVLVAALVVVGLLTPGARRFAALLIVDTAMLLAGPSFYGHYAILAALPAALLVGVAVGRLQGLVRGSRPRIVVPILAAAAALAVVGTAWTPGRIAQLTSPALPASLASAIRAVPGCTASDMAITLVLTNSLTNQLRRGCPVWPDVTGWQYDGGNRTAAGTPIMADQNTLYQRRVMQYLQGGQAVVLLTKRNGLSAANLQTLVAGPLLWEGRRGTMHRVQR